MRLQDKVLHMHRLMQEVEMKRVALELLRGRVEGSESAQLAAAVAETEAKLAEARAAAATAREKKVAMARAAQVRGGAADLWEGACTNTEADTIMLKAYEWREQTGFCWRTP